MEVKIDTDQQIILEKVSKEGGALQYKKYIKGKLIGRGGFANCYEGVDIQQNGKIAIKVIDKKTLSRSRAKQKLLSQIKIHKVLEHPHVVRFIKVFQDLRRVCILLELCQNKSLSEFVRKRKRLSSMEVKRFMHQLISAVEYLHSLRVIHRDLKMGNIFLDQKMNLKVGDLGLAAKLEFHEERKRTMCGTPNYIAPQILTGGTGHSYEVDIWSAGVICYSMMIGHPPFQSTQISKTYEKIKKGVFQFPKIQGLSDDFKDFITKVLIIDPKKRMSLKQMRQHPFLNVPIPQITYNKITLTPIYDSLLNTCRTLLPQQGNPFQQKHIKSKYSTALTLKTQNKENMVQNRQQQQRQIKWRYNGISCYVDYSTKYGLGYMLSNGTFGVYFNDSSLLYLQKKTNVYCYIDNPSVQVDKISYFSEEELKSHKGFNKKYLLLKKFKIYLDDQLVASLKDESYEEDKQIYLRQWVKTKHAIMFRLNNKIFQVDFFDGSRVSLNTENKAIFIKSKKGQTKLTTLDDVSNQKDGQIVRRIKYIKQILHKIKQK